MGWWSCAIWGGDTPWDARAEICDAIGTQWDDDKGEYPYTAKALNENIAAAFMTAQSSPDDKYNTRNVYFQVLGAMILETGAVLPPPLKEKLLEAAANDQWAKESRERKFFIQDFVDKVESHEAGKCAELIGDDAFYKISRADKEAVIEKVVGPKQESLLLMLAKGCKNQDTDRIIEGLDGLDKYFPGWDD
jgi:hypothetical protein